jgi:hypothetical protein
LGEAIGDTITKEHVQPYYRNETWQSDTEAYLCIKVQSPNMNKLEFYAGVGWWENENGEGCFSADAGFWVPTRLRDQLKKAIRGTWEKKQFLLWDDEGIYVASHINVAAACSFQEKLGHLIEIWTVAGKKLGGFLKYLAETPED